MGGIQQGDRGDGRVRIIGLLKENPFPAVETQKRVIDRYVKEKLGGEVHEHIVIPWSQRNIEYSAIYFTLKELGADIVIVYSWNHIGVKCRTLIRNLSAIFKVGVKEIHQAYNGDKITKDEWERHKDFMAKFYLVPTEKTRMIPEYILRTLETMPLSSEEIRLLYNALTEKVDTTLSINTFQAFVEAGALEMVSAEIGNRELDETLLPKPKPKPEELLYKQYMSKRKKYREYRRSRKKED